MVIRDVYSQDPKLTGSEFTVTSIALPSDRMLATFFDILVHFPFFTLLSSFALYKISLSEITFATNSEKLVLFGQVLWVCLVGTIILQSIYIKLWGRTPGMKLMKLALVSIHGNPLSWGTCLLRSTVWVFQFAMLGLPFMEVFSHKERRGLHDRVAETAVVTQKSKGAAPPLAAEKSSIHFILTLSLMGFLGWVTALVSSVNESLSDGTLALSEWREEGLLCSSVDDVLNYSDLGAKTLKDRLDFSLTLFLLDQVDAECFRNEVHLAFIKNIKSPLVWIAQAHLSRAGTDERKAYIKKACEMENDWCSDALLIDQSPLSEAIKLIHSPSFDSNREDQSLALATTEMILLNRLGETEKSTQIETWLQKKGIRATGLVAEQIKTESQRRPELLGPLISTLQSVIAEKDYLKVNSSLCLSQLESSCHSLVPECETMAALIKKNSDPDLDLEVGRAVFKRGVCQRDFREATEIWSSIGNEGLQELVLHGFEFQHREDKGDLLVKLRHFVKNEAQPLSLRFDALQFLLRETNYNKDWELVLPLWAQLNWSQESFLGITQWLLKSDSQDVSRGLLAALPKELKEIPGLKKEFEGTFSKRVRFPASVPLIKPKGESKKGVK